MSKAVFDQTTFDASAFDQEEGIFQKALAGVLSAVGAIGRLIKINTLVGALTSAGVLGRKTLLTLAGTIGGCGLSFDGVDDYVKVPDSASLDITDALTITFWTKLPSIPIDERGFVVKWESFLVRTNPTGEAPRISAFIWIGGGAEPRVSLPTADEETNTWMRLTVTYDGKKWKLYKNGELKSEESRTGKIDITTKPVLVGSQSESNEFLNGLIDEVRIYNRALGADEILRHYNMFRV